jgi:hypothetical protein
MVETGKTDLSPAEAFMLLAGSYLINERGMLAEARLSNATSTGSIEYVSDTGPLRLI